MTKEYFKPYGRQDSSFDNLFKRYHRSLILYAKQIVRDQLVAEDIASEAFLKFLLKEKIEYRELSKWGFLCTCARNECIDFLRKEKLKERKIRMLFRHTKEYEDVVLNVIMRKELIGKVRKVIEEMPPVCKQVIILSCIEGLTREEVAHKLNISPNTVKNHKAVGLKWLKARLIDCTELLSPWAKQSKIESMNQKIAV
jgi:RNA polymerase sigma-70 factor (family 1)